MDRTFLEALCCDIRRHTPSEELAEFATPEGWASYLERYQNATTPEELEKREGERPWLTFYRKWRQARLPSRKGDTKEDCILFSFWAFLRRFLPERKAYFWSVGLLFAGGFVGREALKLRKGKAFEDLITNDGKLTVAGLKVAEAARKKIERFIRRDKRAIRIALSPLGAVTSNVHRKA